MDSIQLPKGLLKGQTVEVWDATAIADAADAHVRKNVESVSLYRGEVKRNLSRNDFLELEFRLDQV